jgi:hypothetical protein
MTAAAATLTELYNQWDTPFTGDPGDAAAAAARAGLTRRLAAAILAAGLHDATGARTRAGAMRIADAGWSGERSAAAAAGSPGWRAALGTYEHATLTSDGQEADCGKWCTCPNDDVFADQWIRYEFWTALGLEKHGYVHSACRQLLQAG